jgi:hypothetical protein
MTINSMKQSMGFQLAGLRPACRNCKHGNEEIAERAPPFDTRSWKCKKGGFRTTAMAVCKEHVPESAAAVAAKQGGSDACL